MPVTFRPGAPGVLDLRRTAQEFLKPAHGTNMGTDVDGAEFALQMIRFPYRQVFGDPGRRRSLRPRTCVPAALSVSPPQGSLRGGARMSNGFDPDAIKSAMVTPRWAAITRTGTTRRRHRPWDARLLRQSTRAGPDRRAGPLRAGRRYDAASFACRFTLTTPDGQPPADMPAPFDPGTATPAGVHLHWAPPDALLRGDRAARRRGLPAIGWRCRRCPIAGSCCESWSSERRVGSERRGWVIEADTTKAVAARAVAGGQRGRGRQRARR